MCSSACREWTSKTSALATASVMLPSRWSIRPPRLGGAKVWWYEDVRRWTLRQLGGLGDPGKGSGCASILEFGRCGAAR